VEVVPDVVVVVVVDDVVVTVPANWMEQGTWRSG
jgi:hypothetical protein